MAGAKKRQKSQGNFGEAKTAVAAWFKGSAGRARLAFVGAVVASAIVIFAWFPAGSLISQRSHLHGTEAELNTLHAQDSALAQERKNLSDAGEIGRIAREQYQLVSPGQQSYEVLPPSGDTAAGTPYTGDPGSDGPVTPSATAELPPGGVTTTTTTTTTPTAATSGSSGDRTGDTHPSSASTSSGGFGSRVLHSLEFWR
jgi:cell division protein FtsB